MRTNAWISAPSVREFRNQTEEPTAVVVAAARRPAVAPAPSAEIAGHGPDQQVPVVVHEHERMDLQAEAHGQFRYQPQEPLPGDGGMERPLAPVPAARDVMPRPRPIDPRQFCHARSLVQMLHYSTL